ncbi:serine/threonine protein kinase [Nocardia sp. NBC_00565]|uniref:serine/threonine-protein kinase n=1 Tax=Nocardia sp. NBC_00565 TaxID=2975993 RepID=UPI002E812C6B|nr:serine/threonine-protein kinase [Nocardia sp. NBC_00565]WUC01591.1 serine/threonine protein kinase [Nocardia sp. NBC_00565]
MLRTENDVVAAFSTAWESAAWESTPHPPEIADFLPDAHALRQAALIELIRVDLRHRWIRRTTTATPRKRLFDYCAEFSELEPGGIPAGLVYEEFVIRRQSGEHVDPRDCLREYPEQAAELRALLNADDVDQSTRRAALEDSVLTEFAKTRAAAERSRTIQVNENTDLTETAQLNQTLGSFRNTDVTRTTVEPTETATALPTTVGTGPGHFDALDRIEIGQSIDDFDLLTGLGSGAFARVFLARQRSLQRLVAVKISADHGTEPQTLAQLDHDYIVRVFDQRLLGSDHATDPSKRRLRLLYMQFLPGGTLLSVLRWVRATPPAERSGQLLLDAVDAAMEEKGEIRPTDSSVRTEIAGLSWPETVAWLGRRVAEALEYASDNGVLHRDVKPANILLTAEAVPKLADFNISFSRNVAGTSPVAYFGGSLAYMSPEQLEACHPGRDRTAEDLDTRSDIYSLGVVLWELLTGAKPFDDSTATATDHGDDTALEGMLERRTAGVDDASLQRVPANCPAALLRVLLTCLESDRTRRWSNGAMLAKQLDLCMDARARDLVDPPPGSWRLRMRSWRLAVLALAIGIPNILASIYNIQHNQHLIVDRLPKDAGNNFMIITTVVNGIFFPLGSALILYMARRVLMVPHGLKRHRRYDAETLRLARADTLLICDRAVLVVFSLWVLAGFTFPIALEVAAGDVPARAVVHFLTSIVVCGAIAVAYPFFLVCFYMVRCIYPVFLRHGEISTEDAVWLRGLDRRANGYLALAASVPLLAVAGVTFLPPTDIPMVIGAVRVLCVGGIIAFIGSYLLFRALEADLRALERVVAPQDSLDRERVSAGRERAVPAAAERRS